MTFIETTGGMKHFRKTCWKFQRSFFKERKTQSILAATIVSGYEPFISGLVIVDGFIFEPRNLKVLLGASSLPPWNGHDWSLEATDRQEMKLLLRAILDDAVDFAFIPTPKPFVMYADHDDLVTFFANTESNLDQISQALSKQGFERVKDYERQL